MDNRRLHIENLAAPPKSISRGILRPHGVSKRLSAQPIDSDRLETADLSSSPSRVARSILGSNTKWESHADPPSRPPVVNDQPLLERGEIIWFLAKRRQALLGSNLTEG